VSRGRYALVSGGRVRHPLDSKNLFVRHRLMSGEVWFYAATHCNTLQHTATHCNTLSHPQLTRCNTLQHATSCCNMLQHDDATHCNKVQESWREDCMLMSRGLYAHVALERIVCSCRSWKDCMLMSLLKGLYVHVAVERIVCSCRCWKSLYMSLLKVAVEVAVESRCWKSLYNPTSKADA